MNSQVPYVVCLRKVMIESFGLRLLTPMMRPPPPLKAVASVLVGALLKEPAPPEVFVPGAGPGLPVPLFGS